MSALFVAAEQLLKSHVGPEDGGKPCDGSKSHCRVRHRNNNECAYHH